MPMDPCKLLSRVLDGVAGGGVAQSSKRVPIQFIDDEWPSCNSNHQPNDNE
jgi:hypothetical protein